MVTYNTGLRYTVLKNQHEFSQNNHITVRFFPFFKVLFYSFFFFSGLRTFLSLCVGREFLFVVLGPEPGILDCVLIVCRIESIRPGLVQGCKAPNGVG